MTALSQDLTEYLQEYNYDRAHTGRHTQVEWTPFRGHVRAFAVRSRKDGVRRAPNPTCVSAGVPA
jgi:hypothetical protein